MASSLVWFGLVLLHINQCGLINAKYCFYAYILNIWFESMFWRCTLLNDQTVLFLTIQFKMSHLPAHSLNVEELELEGERERKGDLWERKVDPWERKVDPWSSIYGSNSTFWSFNSMHLRVLPHPAREYLGAMAMKGYSAFSKAPVLMKPDHQIVFCHIQETCWGRSNPSAEIQPVYSTLPAERA